MLSAVDRVALGAHLQARTTSEKLASIHRAAEHLKQHVEWFNGTTFLDAAALRAWQPYCRVPGTHGGCVVLELDVGALTREVRPAGVEPW